MGKPNSREELKNYCLRKLGYPVVEVNLDDEQISDCIDDGLQYFNERHFDGTLRMFLKYQFTDEDVSRFKTTNKAVSNVDGQILTLTATPNKLNIDTPIFVQGQFEPKGIIKYWNNSLNKLGVILTNPQNKFTTLDVIVDPVNTINISNVADKTEVQTLSIDRQLLSETSIRNPTVTSTTGSLSVGTINGELGKNGVIYKNITASTEINILLTNPFNPFNIGETVQFSGISGTFTIIGIVNKFSKLTEAVNYIEVPDWIIGVNKIFDFIDKSSINMFDIRYQLRLNDLYNFTSAELLYYDMVQTRLQFMYFILEGAKQLRFNKAMGRIYLDLDFKEDIQTGDFVVLDCYRVLDPAESYRMWNDMFLKKYVTAIMKKQWGQNLIKYNGVQLPGGLTLNGRQIYEDAVQEITDLEQRMNAYEFSEPVMDVLG